MLSIPAPQTLRLVPAAVVLLALAGGCTSVHKTTPVLEDVAYEIDRWGYGGRFGRELTTDHYEIRTTIDDPVLLEAIPQVVETAYLFYRELVPSAREPEERMQVYLFARREEWVDFTKRFAGPRAQVLLKVRNGGYSERGVSVAEYVSHSITFPLLTHEGFHQYLYHCVDGRIPAWLNEGLAVLCEGQRWSNSGLQEFDPWYNPTRRNALADVILRKELFPLDELLCINAGHVVGGSAREIGAYYGQVWALMLFLREGQEGKYAEPFARLLQTIGQQDLDDFARAAYVSANDGEFNLGRELFRSFISDDIETVEREYKEFLNREILNAR